jgi:hypothetical protein
MRRPILRLSLAALGLILIAIATLLLSPSARLIAPVWLPYDLIGRRMSPTPPEVEQFVLRSGQEFCSVGRDSDCGGYRVVGARALPLDQAAQQRGISGGWCVDYVILRRNQGRLTGNIVYWANIPRAMIVSQAIDRGFEASGVEDCSTARLE